MDQHESQGLESSTFCTSIRRRKSHILSLEQIEAFENERIPEKGDSPEHSCLSQALNKDMEFDHKEVITGELYCRHIEEEESRSKETFTEEEPQSSENMKESNSSREMVSKEELHCDCLVEGDHSLSKSSVEAEETESSRKVEDEGFLSMTPLLQAHHAFEKMEDFVHKVWEGRWRVIPHDVLPDWLKDNDFLLHGHRPPMPSFRACFKSIFRIHTETGNIWTHLLGCVFFLCLGVFYMFRPNITFVAPVQEKVAVGMFFLGAILCLCFSWLFHTVYCHSEAVSRMFSKLDYSGIALLIMGSFVPWLYYSFYCSPEPRFIYLIVICVLGIIAIVVSQWDRFATPQYRGVRAGVFVGLGLSGLIPTLHFMFAEGFIRATTIGQMGWLFLMAFLYISGAALYAARIPERFFPGKCDIWFHSHQLFHILVVAGACVHFHGVCNLQEFRFTTGGGCSAGDAL